MTWLASVLWHVLCWAKTKLVGKTRIFTQIQTIVPAGLTIFVFAFFFLKPIAHRMFLMKIKTSCIKFIVLNLVPWVHVFVTLCDKTGSMHKVLLLHTEIEKLSGAKAVVWLFEKWDELLFFHGILFVFKKWLTEKVRLCRLGYLAIFSR